MLCSDPQLLEDIRTKHIFLSLSENMNEFAMSFLNGKKYHDGECLFTASHLAPISFTLDFDSHNTTLIDHG